MTILEAQKKVPVLGYRDRGIVKIPIIKLHGLFYEYEHCEDDVNQGPNNQGPAVYLFITFLFTT